MSHGLIPILPEAGNKAYDSYVSAVGEVAFHWNALLEACGLIFGHVAGTSQSVGFGVWYSTNSDRAQLAMLSGALRARTAEGLPWTSHARATDDITWVINEVQNKLADRRNDAIHAPAELGFSVFERSDGALQLGEIEIGPSFFHGHPRATKLNGRELLDEFRWYADTAAALTTFVKLMEATLCLADAPWPERPRLPSLGQPRGS